MRPEQFDSWLTVDPKGLYCRPGRFHIDPHGAVGQRGGHPWTFRPCAAGT